MNIVTDGSEHVFVTIGSHIRAYKWSFQGFELVYDNMRDVKK